MEDQKPGPWLDCILDFVKGKGLEPKLKTFSKLSKLGDVVSKLVQPKCITVGGLGAAAGQYFVIILEKNSFFDIICITFHTFLEPFETTKFLRFESQLKKSN